MPVNLSTPVVSSVSVLPNLHVHWSIEDNEVHMVARSGDSEKVVRMAAAAFITGINAQTGTARQRAWKLFLDEAGLTGSVT